jgi:hypothetical protein
LGSVGVVGELPFEEHASTMITRRPRTETMAALFTTASFTMGALAPRG